MKGFLLGLSAAMLFVISVPFQVNAAGNLQIIAEPGIRVRLNDEAKGETTQRAGGMYLDGLAAGSYKLKAEKASGDLLAASIMIYDERTVAVKLVFNNDSMVVESMVVSRAILPAGNGGELVLRSVPLGARIFVNGKEIGLADLLLHNVPPASHSVRFQLQGKELDSSVEVNAKERIALVADFRDGRIVKTSSRENLKTSAPAGGEFGPEEIIIQSLSATKPARFPHRKHQKKFACGECHHGMDDAGQQIPYATGMKTQHCISCHNPDMMPDNSLNTVKLAAHAKCKGCHKKVAEKDAHAGPIAKCGGCHIKQTK